MNVRVGRKEIVHNSAEQAQNIHKEYTKQVLKALRRSSRTVTLTLSRYAFGRNYARLLKRSRQTEHAQSHHSSCLGHEYNLTAIQKIIPQNY